MYSEDGYRRPFISDEPPRGQPNTLAVRNTGPLEFPMNAHVAADPRRRGMPGGGRPPSGMTIQGGATESFPIEPSVDSVEIFLQTEGRNLEAKIEVLQGPDCVRQTVDLNEDWGYDRPFSFTLETPGYGSVVRIINTAPMTFPFTASVVPRSINRGGYGHEDRYAHMGGGSQLDPYGSRGRGGWGGQTSLGGYPGSGYQRGGRYDAYPGAPYQGAPYQGGPYQFDPRVY